MLKQYPHYLFAVVAGGESAQDANGNWVDSVSTNEFISVCREETSGKGTQVQVAGGKFVFSSSLVQLPFGAKLVENGTSVVVCNDREGVDVRIRGIVLKYDVGQLHNRLWV